MQAAGRSVPECVAPSFGAFDGALAKWLTALAAFGGDRLEVAADCARKPGVADSLRSDRADTLPPDCID